MKPKDEKICASCGRPFEMRKKWEGKWDQIRYCSARCRSARPTSLDRELERATLRLLGERSRTSSLCPSEVARAVRPDDWRPLMPKVRRVAGRLRAREAVVVTQSDKVVDPQRVRGPVRLRRGSRFQESVEAED